MSYCPKCGSKIHENETFCVSCGVKLPEDIHERYPELNQKGFNRWWIAPIVVLVIALSSLISTHFYLNYLQEQAVESYQSGIELANDGQYLKAKEKLEQSLDYKSNYKAADASLQFINLAIEIKKSLNSIDQLINSHAYKQAINLTHDSESKLKQYNGEIVNQLLDDIIAKRNEVKVAQIKNQLDEDTSIDELKIQLWQIETIKTENAQKLEDQMKERIINRSFNQASEELKENQFSSALAIVNDALRYVPNSEKLKSLKTTIEKKKVAFETEQQQRIAQALNQYEIEQQHNENSAIELLNIEAVINENDEIVVKGEIKSVATVPVYSISVVYSLYDNNDELILENETFVYPETLYPQETGKFEYTHYDLEEKPEVNIEQIKWFLEGQQE